ncbi:MAG: hypothetical protein CK427_17010, partial [Leptospira sp.]
YDKQNGWGGMIGIGNGANNLAVSFSQRGNTSIDGSVGLSKDKASWLSNVQLTASHQTNGSTTIGANFNEGKGDRDGWNYGLNYDLNGGGPSASIGYTNPGSQLGLTSTIDRNGLSTSAEHLGTSIATMTQDGVQMDEINWMQQNINAAQDATETSQGNVETLKERGYSEEQIRNMTPDQHDELANAIRTENDNNTLVAKGLDPDTMTPEQRNIALNDLQPVIHSPLDDLLGALGTIGGGLIGSLGLAFGRKREDEITGEATVRDGKVDGETSQSNILNGLTLASISVAEQNTKGEKETPKKTLVLSPENQKIQDLEAEVQKRRDELDKTTRLTSPFSVNQKSYSRTYTLAEAKLNDSINALEKAKKQQTDRILKTSDGKKLSFELSNARYVMDDILKSNEFKTQTDAMNQSLVAKNVLENTIKDLKKENRPAAEIKIHQDALDRTKDSISKAQASLDSMTKKARKDVDNAKAKLDNFINKERVKENQVIKDIEKAKKDSDALNKYKATDFGVTQAQFDKKYILIEKSGLLKAEDKSMLKSLSSEINEINKLKTELKYPEMLIKDGAKIREILSNPNTLPEVKQYLVKLESILASTGDSIERQLQLDKLKKDNLLKTIDKGLDGRINQLRAESNAVLNNAVIRENQKYNQDELSKLTASNILKKEFNNETSFNNYMENYATPREVIYSKGLDLIHQKSILLERLETATPSEKVKIGRELKELDAQIKTQDKSISSFELARKADQPVVDYLKDIKKNTEDELDAIQRSKKEIETKMKSLDQGKSLDAQILKDLNDLKDTLKAREEKLNVIVENLPDDAAIERAAKHISNQKINLKLNEGVVNPAGSENKRIIYYNSSFGPDGYGTKVNAYQYLTNSDFHKGIDINGSIGDPVRSITQGSILSSTKGASYFMPPYSVLRESGIVYLNKGNANEGYYDASGKKLSNADLYPKIIATSTKFTEIGLEYKVDSQTGKEGFYDKNGKELSIKELSLVDKKINFDLTPSKTGVQYNSNTQTYFRTEFDNNKKVFPELTPAEVEMLPAELRKGSPKDIEKNFSGNGNSVTIKSEINGIKYNVIYKHLDEYPLDANGNFTGQDGKPTKTLSKGQEFGKLGTTGSSTGAHLHLEVQIHPVNGVLPEPPEKDRFHYNKIESPQGSYYLVNADYFLNNISNK